MALTPGTRLGPYEITAQLGAGGMGEVYRARDTKLGREIAIKVLPAALTNDSERLARFTREAHVLAALNHPNIASIYQLEETPEGPALVMELVEGETLAARISRGAIRVDEALAIARKIAEALDAAHRQGITHRDLKPANIMLVHRGGRSSPPDVKLLDFGLAKLHASVPAGTTSLPTIPATTDGMVIGTIYYMAPEQLEGKAADARTDIYALGAVIQEMVTGKRAFDGMVPLAPPTLDRIVKRCLARDPEERWQSARDLGAELKWVEEGDGSVASHHAPAVSDTKRRNRRRLAIAGGALLMAAAIAGVAVRSVTRSAPSLPPTTVTRLTITLPGRDRLPTVEQPRIVLALSPAGDRLAYVAMRGDNQQIFVRSMDSLDVLPLAGTEGATNPFFSPDGHWIGFTVGGKLKKVPATGGVVVTIGESGSTANILAPVWGSGERILFNDTLGGPLMEIGANGGSPRPLVRESTEGAAAASFLPNSRDILFVSLSTPYLAGRIMARSLDSGVERPVGVNGSFPRYVSSGHLIFWRTGSLFAVPFAPKTLQITGLEVAVLENVASGNFAVSNNGSLAYVTGVPPGPQRRIVWVSRNGIEEPVDAPIRAYDSPQISPDGRRIAIEIGPQTWIYDLARNALTRLTFDGNVNDSPIWSPDGSHIAVRSDRAGIAHVFWQLADGGGRAEQLTDGQTGQLPRSFSPDGETLVYQEVSPATRRDLWLLRLHDRKAEPFVKTPSTEGGAKSAPDGKWLAYVSDQTGRPEVYVQPFPASGSKWQVSIDGGTEPAWNRNGRELFFRNGNGMFAVDVTSQPTFSTGKPHVLFEGNFARSLFPLTGAAYDVSPDGQRFLMLKETGENTIANVVDVVLNWTEELKRRVPTK